VITKMAFIGVIDAATGTKVSIGSDAAHAYYALIGSPIEIGAKDRLRKILDLFAEKGLNVIKPVKISGDVWIRVDNLTYTSESEWGEVKEAICGFIQKYAQNCSEAYQWREDENIINIGVLVSKNGIVKLYYISIKYA